MNILLHTIALEPARWTAARVSQNLVELLPQIAAAGFRELEIYEPHLTEETTRPEIREAFAASGARPVVLSSYLDLTPIGTSDSELQPKIQKLAERTDYYGFEKVRLFAGLRLHPGDVRAVDLFQKKLAHVAASLPQLEILLETHDGSLADDPHVAARIVRELALPNLGLLFQPTFFARRTATLRQVRIQKPFIRHLHLQNRKADLSFARLAEGIAPWPEIFRELPTGLDATLEFVPRGICACEDFDLGATLTEACAEADYVRSLVSRGGDGAGEGRN